MEINLYKDRFLPTTPTSEDDGVYFIKQPTSIKFKYYVIDKGRVYEIDAITAEYLSQQLLTKLDSPNGTILQYIRGNGTLATLNKEAVGLPNVDNTSDLNKPISTATQIALNLKANDSDVVHINGYEQIVGEKVFTTLPISEASPTSLGHLTNKAYVDGRINDIEVSNIEWVEEEW